MCQNSVHYYLREGMCKLLFAQEEYLAIEKVDWLRITREENQGAKQSERGLRRVTGLSPTPPQPPSALISLPLLRYIRYLVF